MGSLWAHTEESHQYCHFVHVLLLILVKISTSAVVVVVVNILSVMLPTKVTLILPQLIMCAVLVLFECMYDCFAVLVRVFVM